jgi:hypothetical protein
MKNTAFRFFFILLLFFIAPWDYLGYIPVLSYLLDGYAIAEEWIVALCNRHLWHVAEVLNMDGGGSGDTSYAWAQFYTVLLLSVAGALLWSLIDKKRQKPYKTLSFGLNVVVRYHVAMVALLYGIHKLFALQMPFPNLSLLSTALGDLLPMRLSWMFMGYSAPYQIFSGVMETLVGLLLLSRKTALAGALLGTGVFANVFALNLCYDIPVKLFSMQTLFCCLFLTWNDRKRIWHFFVLNRNTTPSVTYERVFPKRWQRITRILLKAAFILMFVVLQFIQSWSMYSEEKVQAALQPIEAGIYDITERVENGDTLSAGEGNIRWNDMVFDRDGSGSVYPADTLLRQRYKRGYFVYEADTVAGFLRFKKGFSDTTGLFQLKYAILDDSTLSLAGIVRSDTLSLVLQRRNRQFPLAERQFHWISEANR